EGRGPGATAGRAEAGLTEREGQRQGQGERPCLPGATAEAADPGIVWTVGASGHGESDEQLLEAPPSRARVRHICLMSNTSNSISGPPWGPQEALRRGRCEPCAGARPG